MPAWTATAAPILDRLPERIWRLQAVEIGPAIGIRLGWPASERLGVEAASGNPEAVWCALADGLGRVLPGLAGPERLAGLQRVMRTAGWWWPLERVALMTDRWLCTATSRAGCTAPTGRRWLMPTGGPCTPGMACRSRAS